MKTLYGWHWMALVDGGQKKREFDRPKITTAPTQNDRAKPSLDIYNSLVLINFHNYRNAKGVAMNGMHLIH